MQKRITFRGPEITIEVEPLSLIRQNHAPSIMSLGFVRPKTSEKQARALSAQTIGLACVEVHYNSGPRSDSVSNPNCRSEFSALRATNGVKLTSASHHFVCHHVLRRRFSSLFSSRVENREHDKSVRPWKSETLPHSTPRCNCREFVLGSHLMS